MRLLRPVLVGVLMTVCGSCRAVEGSRCSAPDVVDTVRSLVEKSENPLAIAMLSPTYSLDAIRTASSSSNATICEARLSTTYQMPAPSSHPINRPLPPDAAPEQAVREPRTETKEITYKVELTDDGQSYVTIIFSEADIIGEQNARQQEQQQQYEFRQQDLQRQQEDQQYEQQEQMRERGQ